MIDFFKPCDTSDYDVRYYEEEYFDLDTFLYNENIIMMNWEDIPHIKAMSEADLINRFSLYMCHINDEMKEMVDAYNNETRLNYYRELVDIAMYTASAINLLYMKYKVIWEVEYNKGNISSSDMYEYPRTLFDDRTDDYDIETISLDWRNYISGKPIEKNEELITFIMYRLSLIRENFPQRKWHKSKLRFNAFEYMTELKNSFYQGCDIICTIIWFMLELTNTNRISEIINEKQRKIVRDALVTGSNLSEEQIERLEKLKRNL